MLDTIYNEDCLEGMKRIPDCSVDMILCDLPYGTTACKWDSVIPLEPLWGQYLRVCVPSAAIVLTSSQPFTAALVMSQLRIFRHEWIWLKNTAGNFLNSVREPMKEHESVLVFSRGRWTYNKQPQDRSGGGLSRTKYNITQGRPTSNYGPYKEITFAGGTRPDQRVPSSWQKFNTQRGLHPSQKPTALFEYLIRTYSNPGETVLDNAIGSGTTAIACLNTGRHYIGFEKDPNYFRIAQDRIATHQPQLVAVA